MLFTARMRSSVTAMCMVYVDYSARAKVSVPANIHYRHIRQCLKAGLTMIGMGSGGM